MIEVFYTTTANQTMCDMFRMRARDGETTEQVITRAKAKVAKIGGRFCYIGV